MGECLLFVEVLGSFLIVCASNFSLLTGNLKGNEDSMLPKIFARV